MWKLSVIVRSLASVLLRIGPADMDKCCPLRAAESVLAKVAGARHEVGLLHNHHNRVQRFSNYCSLKILADGWRQMAHYICE